ncbi:MAG: SDR family oxidoreductase [Geminicoccaceae bacterium]
MPTILITGTGRGIGRKLAELFVREGYEVLAASRNGPSIYATESVTMDVADRSSIEAAARGLEGRAIDVLVNNAGIFGERGTGLHAFDDASWHEVLDVNVLGPARVCAAFLPHLEAGAQKRIVTISSRMGSMAANSGGEMVYRSSKAAVNAVMKTLSIDLAGRGITSTMVHPGWVRTDMGGENASISVDESAEGIRDVIIALNSDTNGAFLNHDGSPVPW